MLKGFYTAASGILTQQRNINVLTNNIANVKTPGYRASRVVTRTFEEEFLTRVEGMNKTVIGPGSGMPIIEEVKLKFDPSSLEETGRNYDFAIDGEGYFNVLSTVGEIGENVPDENGEAAVGGDEENLQYLTRNGSFDVDDQNQLILPGVGLVLGEKGPIVLPTSHFRVTGDGSIYDENGEYVDKLLVTLPPEDTEILHRSNGLYQIEDMEQNIPIGEDTTIAQGWTEHSNIDLNQEYTMVMQAQRAFQACSTALQIIDEIDKKAASQIASV